jgi:hypothetical protein
VWYYVDFSYVDNKSAMIISTMIICYIAVLCVAAATGDAVSGKHMLKMANQFWIAVS